MSIHTRCTLFLITTLFASLLSVLVEILSSKAEGPGLLSLTAGLVAGIWWSQHCEWAQPLLGNPGPAPRCCRPGPPETRPAALLAVSLLQGRRPEFTPRVRKIPWRRAWQPTPVLLPGESPWTEAPGGLQSMGSQRVVTNTFIISAVYSQKTHFFLKYSVSGNAFPSHTQTAMAGGTLNPRGEWAIPKDSTWQAGRPEVVSHHVQSGPDLSRQPGCRGTPPITRPLKFTPPWEGPGGGRRCQQ